MLKAGVMNKKPGNGGQMCAFGAVTNARENMRKCLKGLTLKTFITGHIYIHCQPDMDCVCLAFL